MHSLPQPLSNILIGQLDLPIRCTRVGELLSFVGVAKVTPQPLEFCREFVVSVFLRHHLASTSYLNMTLKTKLMRSNGRNKKKVTLITWSLGSRLQSASVSSFPSRYLRLDSLTSSSPGSGSDRYLSSWVRALSRFFSNAGTQINHIYVYKYVLLFRF